MGGIHNVDFLLGLEHASLAEPLEHPLGEVLEGHVDARTCFGTYLKEGDSVSVSECLTFLLFHGALGREIRLGGHEHEVDTEFRVLLYVMPWVDEGLALSQSTHDQTYIHESTFWNDRLSAMS